MQSVSIDTKILVFTYRRTLPSSPTLAESSGTSFGSPFRCGRSSPCCAGSSTSRAAPPRRRCRRRSWWACPCGSTSLRVDCGIRTSSPSADPTTWPSGCHTRSPRRRSTPRGAESWGCPRRLRDLQEKRVVSNLSSLATDHQSITEYYGHEILRFNVLEHRVAIDFLDTFVGQVVLDPVEHVVLVQQVPCNSID